MTLELLVALSPMVSVGMTFAENDAVRDTDLLTVVPGELFWEPETASG